MTLLTAIHLASAEDAPNAEHVERLVREFAFSSNTNLNTNTVFQIRHFDITGLWESMRLQIFDVEYTSKDAQKFNGFVGVYSLGKVSVLAPNLGGYGLMSGVIHKGEFYYTYSWGSGIHRTHVAKLRMVGDKLESSESAGFPGQDVFVEVDPSGKLIVLSGKYTAFNHWHKATEVGFIGKANSSGVLEIVDAKGGVITPTFPSR